MSEPIQSIAQNNYILQAPPDSSYMNVSGLEYDGDKISGYAGSAFKAGDTLPESVSAATDYVTATSGNINDTISAVTTNSGTWGGSALPISAGPGIKVDLVDNTLVFSNDETVLADNIDNAATAFTLSEKAGNFDRLRLYSTKGPICEISASDTYLTWAASWIDGTANGLLNRVYQARSNDGISWSGGRVYGYHGNGSTATTNDYGDSGWYLETKKIVGINRKN